MSRKNRRKRSKGFGSPAQPETARSQPKYSIRDFEKSEIEPLAYRVTPVMEKAAEECARKYRLGVVFQPEGHDVMMFSRPTGDRFIDAHLSAYPNAKVVMAKQLGDGQSMFPWDTSRIVDGYYQPKRIPGLIKH